MNTATLELEHKRSTHVQTIESEPPRVAEAPEISSGAWKVIISLLVGAVVLLGTIAVYVFSGLHRYQNF